MTGVSYSIVYDRIDKFIDTRNGLNNPNKIKDRLYFVSELAGLLCGEAYTSNINTDDIVSFIDLVESHTITNMIVDGVVSPISDLIDFNIVNHPLYHATEYKLMYHKPGRTQVGPGEFFLCFYDANSTYGINSQLNYDVIVDDKTIELKKIYTNFATVNHMDRYQECDDLDLFLIIQPVSDASNPRRRSQYCCIDLAKHHWTDVFEHRGETLSIK